jgi:hypothetical protein
VVSRVVVESVERPTWLEHETRPEAGLVGELALEK